MVRSLRWARGEWPFVLTVAIILAGLITMASMHDQWRPGAAVVAVGLLVAAALRSVLPQPRAGMLVARKRWMDVVCYLVMGGVILGLDIRLH